MKKIILSILILTTISVSAQNVSIPDANFKTYLVGNTAINTNGDTEIQTSEATAFTGLISCGGLTISDLTGIEAFTNLTDLRCNNNAITSLNVSQNTALTGLYCHNNSLTSLNVTNNTALTYLACGDNSLTSLNVTQNTALTKLECYSNLLTNLDITLNTDLTHLWCYDNSFTSLNVSQNTALTYLTCNDNSLTNIDVTQNTALTGLSCNYNSLNSLNLTQNTALTTLYCSSNSLTSLNVANGNNTAITDFYATSNPNLTCIQVDDVAWSTTNWTNIDATASFSLNCNTSTGVNETKKITLTIYPNPVTNQLSLNNGELKIESILILDITGKTVKTIKGNVKTIDVADLTKGIYFIQIQTEKGLINKKFIKE